MKKATLLLLAATAIFSCQKKDHELQTPGQDQQTAQQKKPAPPPGNANPVITFSRSHKVSNTLSVPAIYVMDENGGNQTAVYTNYYRQGGNMVVQSPNNPAWSPDGSKICFTLNNADLYTLNITLVNGLPVGSNAIKIADGVAAGGSYKEGKWRPGANTIACVWKKTGETDKIHLVPATGGTPALLYSAANSDWFIENDIAFKSDGSQLLFSERQVSTGEAFLKVLDVSTGLVINSIHFEQFRSIRGVDWGKTPGTSIVAIQGLPICDMNTTIGLNAMHQVEMLDVSQEVPVLTKLGSDKGGIAWSPDDTKITLTSGIGRICGGNNCCASDYSSVQVYTLATQSMTLFNTNGGKFPDWKR